MNKQTQTAAPHDELVPDRIMRAELGGVSATTIDRWEKDPQLNFPPKIVIRRHAFRSRITLEEFKKRMVTRAIKDRSGKRGRK